MFEWIDDPNRSITRLCAVSNDRAGMFSVLAGVLSISGFDILGSKVLTRSDGVTINTFYLTGLYGGVFNNMRIRELFSRRVASALSDNRALDAEVAEMFYGVRGGARTNPFCPTCFCAAKAARRFSKCGGAIGRGCCTKSPEPCGTADTTSYLPASIPKPDGRATLSIFARIRLPRRKPSL